MTGVLGYDPQLSVHQRSPSGGTRHWHAAPQTQLSEGTGRTETPPRGTADLHPLLQRHAEQDAHPPSSSTRPSHIVATGPNAFSASVGLYLSQYIGATLAAVCETKKGLPHKNNKMALFLLMYSISEAIILLRFSYRRGYMKKG